MVLVNTQLTVRTGWAPEAEGPAAREAKGWRWVGGGTGSVHPTAGPTAAQRLPAGARLSSARKSWAALPVALCPRPLA